LCAFAFNPVIKRHFVDVQPALYRMEEDPLESVTAALYELSRRRKNWSSSAMELQGSGKPVLNYARAFIGGRSFQSIK
jgi:hypothetical protein